MAMAPHRHVSWWYPLGVLVILACFFLFVDLLVNAGLQIFTVGTLIAAFFVGAGLTLRSLASRVDRKPAALVAGVILLAASLSILPLAIRSGVPPLQGISAERTYSVPFDNTTKNLEVTVNDPVGSVYVTSVDTVDYLARAWVNVTGRGDHNQAVTGIRWAPEANGQNVSRVALDLPTPTGIYFFWGVNYRVDLQVSRSPVLNLSIITTTGSVRATLGAGTRVGVVDLQTTTGGVTLDMDRTHLQTYTSINLQTTTGGVSSKVDFPDGPRTTIPFVGKATTGGVAVTLNLGPGVGARGSGSTTTGGVSLDTQKYLGTRESFKTPNVDAGTAITVLDLTLSTTTGGVRID